MSLCRERPHIRPDLRGHVRYSRRARHSRVGYVAPSALAIAIVTIAPMTAPMTDAMLKRPAAASEIGDKNQPPRSAPRIPSPGSSSMAFAVARRDKSATPSPMMQPTPAHKMTFMSSFARRLPFPTTLGRILPGLRGPHEPVYPSQADSNLEQSPCVPSVRQYPRPLSLLSPDRYGSA